MVRNLPVNAGDMGWILGLGRYHRPMSNSAQAAQLLKPAHLQAALCNEKPVCHGGAAPAHYS